MDTKVSAVEVYTQAAINVANDNSHGYSQANRWGEPDYDCSSLVISVVQYAGIPVKDRGATYTGNMRDAFLACGFRDVTSSCNLSTCSGMLRGDILLVHTSKAQHTAIYIGNGQLVHARSSEGNSLRGDQSGNEIRVQSYYNAPWGIVMRYDSGSSSGVAVPSEADTEDTISATDSIVLRYGVKHQKVVTLQKMLMKLGYDVGPDGADGDFGINTENAVILFQRDNGLTDDGVVGYKTRQALNEAYQKLQNKKQTANSDSKDDPYLTLRFKVGDTVKFTGDRHYLSADGRKERLCRPGKAKVTIVKANAKYPYHLVRTIGGGSNVFGWVSADDVEAAQ